MFNGGRRDSVVNSTIDKVPMFYFFFAQKQSPRLMRRLRCNWGDNNLGIINSKRKLACYIAINFLT